MYLIEQVRNDISFSNYFGNLEKGFFKPACLLETGSYEA